MITFIIDTHKDYPKRLNFNELYYNIYRDKRQFFFHDVLLKNPDWPEPLVPKNYNHFKDKWTYITNDYLLNSVKFEYCDYIIDNMYVEAFLPINPYGPTGLGGRGLLGNWGPNHAADPIITTWNEKKKIYELLVIERSDTPGLWALPGGMQDKEEHLSKTVIRELKEETNLILNINSAKLVYSGYVNDPRNTDHAWLETNAYHFNLNKEQRINLINVMEAGDDAISIKLIDIDYNNKEFNDMYANHKEFVNEAMKCLCN